MSKTFSGGYGGGVLWSESRDSAGLLRFVAAPTFAVMALLAGLPGDGPMDVLCSSARDDSFLSGMVPMYLLMSVFHLPPWLKLVSGGRDGARPSKAIAVGEDT